MVVMSTISVIWMKALQRTARGDSVSKRGVLVRYCGTEIIQLVREKTVVLPTPPFNQ